MTSIPLEHAKAARLIGQSYSWDGYGGKRLGDVPDAVLKSARKFFAERLAAAEYERPGRSDSRLVDQIEAIRVVLADREANSPQARLAL